jgi:TetR/AcrR family transcriptional repressor of nem operon
MARPREFDTGEALEKAMQVFWAKGYQASSLNDLIGAMGISKSSFYETFASKHDLFLTAIEYYDRTSVARLVNALEGEGPARPAIAGVFAAIIDALLVEGGRKGCFLGNCAVEAAPHDGDVEARVARSLARIEAAYYQAVRRGQQAGDISSDHDPRSLARYLMSSANGLMVVGKANPDRATLEDVARVVMSALD